MTGALSRPSFHDVKSCLGSSVRKCPSIGGIFQNAKQLLIVRQSPVRAADPISDTERREQYPLVVIPKQHLPQRAHLLKALKHSPDGLLNLPVRGDLDPVRLAPRVSYWNSGEHFAAEHFLAVCLLRSLP